MSIFHHFLQDGNLPIEKLLLSLKEENTVLLDVREADDYNRGHIAQALNFPLSQIEHFQGSQKNHYLVICQSGIRSQRAKDFLIAKGYQAISVEGGMKDWHGTVECHLK